MGWGSSQQNQVSVHQPANIGVILRPSSEGSLLKQSLLRAYPNSRHTHITLLVMSSGFNFTLPFFVKYQFWLPKIHQIGIVCLYESITPAFYLLKVTKKNMFFFPWSESIKQIYIYIYMFPEIGVPPNHQFLQQDLPLQTTNHPFLGIPID